MHFTASKSVVKSIFSDFQNRENRTTKQTVFNFTSEPNFRFKQPRRADHSTSYLAFVKSFFQNPEEQICIREKPKKSKPKSLVKRILRLVTTHSNQVSDEEPRILHQPKMASRDYFNFSKFSLSDLINMVTGNRNNRLLVFHLFTINFYGTLFNHPNGLRCACYQASIFQ